MPVTIVIEMLTKGLNSSTVAMFRVAVYGPGKTAVQSAEPRQLTFAPPTYFEPQEDLETFPQ